MAGRRDHPTCIRLHRAFSWLARVETLEEEDVDLALVSQWVAFNALYGQWNELAKHPHADRESWGVFLSRMLELDQDGLLSQMLQEHRGLVLAVCEDAYLDGTFWQDPSDERARQVRRARFKAQSWYAEKNWTLLLDAIIERIYLLRCQLIHGAASYGGQLNRRSVFRCRTMLGHLLTTFLRILIQHGADEDWGIMCYPPLAGRTSQLPR